MILNEQLNKGKWRWINVQWQPPASALGAHRGKASQMKIQIDLQGTVMETQTNCKFIMARVIDFKINNDNKTINTLLPQDDSAFYSSSSSDSDGADDGQQRPAYTPHKFRNFVSIGRGKDPTPIKATPAAAPNYYTPSNANLCQTKLHLHQQMSHIFNGPNVRQLQDFGTKVKSKTTKRIGPVLSKKMHRTLVPISKQRSVTHDGPENNMFSEKMEKIEQNMITMFDKLLQPQEQSLNESLKKANQSILQNRFKYKSAKITDIKLVNQQDLKLLLEAEQAQKAYAFSQYLNQMKDQNSESREGNIKSQEFNPVTTKSLDYGSRQRVLADRARKFSTMSHDSQGVLIDKLAAKNRAHSRNSHTHTVSQIEKQNNDLMYNLKKDANQCMEEGTLCQSRNASKEKTEKMGHPSVPTSMAEQQSDHHQTQTFNNVNSSLKDRTSQNTIPDTQQDTQQEEKQIFTAQYHIVENSQEMNSNVNSTPKTQYDHRKKLKGLANTADRENVESLQNFNGEVIVIQNEFGGVDFVNKQFSMNHQNILANSQSVENSTQQNNHSGELMSKMLSQVESYQIDPDMDMTEQTTIQLKSMMNQGSLQDKKNGNITLTIQERHKQSKYLLRNQRMRLFSPVTKAKYHNKMLTHHADLLSFASKECSVSQDDQSQFNTTCQQFQLQNNALRVFRAVSPQNDARKVKGTFTDHLMVRGEGQQADQKNPQQVVQMNININTPDQTHNTELNLSPEANVKVNGHARQPNPINVLNNPSILQITQDLGSLKNSKVMSSQTNQSAGKAAGQDGYPVKLQDLTSGQDDMFTAYDNKESPKQLINIYPHPANSSIQYSNVSNNQSAQCSPAHQKKHSILLKSGPKEAKMRMDSKDCGKTTNKNECTSVSPQSNMTPLRAINLQEQYNDIERQVIVDSEQHSGTRQNNNLNTTDNQITTDKFGSVNSVRDPHRGTSSSFTGKIESQRNSTVTPSVEQRKNSGTYIKILTPTIREQNVEARSSIIKCSSKKMIERLSEKGSADQQNSTVDKNNKILDNVLRDVIDNEGDDTTFHGGRRTSMLENEITEIARSTSKIRNLNRTNLDQIVQSSIEEKPLEPEGQRQSEVQNNQRRLDNTASQRVTPLTPNSQRRVNLSIRKKNSTIYKIPDKNLFLNRVNIGDADAPTLRDVEYRETDKDKSDYTADLYSDRMKKPLSQTLKDRKAHLDSAMNLQKPPGGKNDNTFSAQSVSASVESINYRIKAISNHAINIFNFDKNKSRSSGKSGKLASDQLFIRPPHLYPTLQQSKKNQKSNAAKSLAPGQNIMKNKQVFKPAIWSEVRQLDDISQFNQDAKKQPIKEQDKVNQHGLQTLMIEKPRSVYDTAPVMQDAKLQDLNANPRQTSSPLNMWKRMNEANWQRIQQEGYIPIPLKSTKQQIKNKLGVANRIQPVLTTEQLSNMRAGGDGRSNLLEASAKSATKPTVKQTLSVAEQFRKRKRGTNANTRMQQQYLTTRPSHRDNSPTSWRSQGDDLGSVKVDFIAHELMEQDAASKLQLTQFPTTLNIMTKKNERDGKYAIKFLPNNFLNPGAHHHRIESEFMKDKSTLPMVTMEQSLQEQYQDYQIINAHMTRQVKSQQQKVRSQFKKISMKAGTNQSSRSNCKMLTGQGLGLQSLDPNSKGEVNRAAQTMLRSFSPESEGCKILMRPNFQQNYKYDPMMQKRATEQDVTRHFDSRDNSTDIMHNTANENGKTPVMSHHDGKHYKGEHLKSEFSILMKEQYLESTVKKHAGEQTKASDCNDVMDMGTRYKDAPLYGSGNPTEIADLGSQKDLQTPCKTKSGLVSEMTPVQRQQHPRTSMQAYQTANSIKQAEDQEKVSKNASYLAKPKPVSTSLRQRQQIGSIAINEQVLRTDNLNLSAKVKSELDKKKNADLGRNEATALPMAGNLGGGGQQSARTQNKLRAAYHEQETLRGHESTLKISGHNIQCEQPHSNIAYLEHKINQLKVQLLHKTIEAPEQDTAHGERSKTSEQRRTKFADLIFEADSSNHKNDQMLPQFSSMRKSQQWVKELAKNSTANRSDRQTNNSILDDLIEFDNLELEQKPGGPEHLGSELIVENKLNPQRFGSNVVISQLIQQGKQTTDLFVSGGESV